MSRASGSIRTEGPEATHALGEAIAAHLGPGSVLALTGDLGAGKTVLAKGVASGLGIAPGAVKSPTYTLVHEHGGGRVPLVHVDAYRLSGPRAFCDLGLDTVLRPDAVCVIEWADRVDAALPPSRLEVHVAHAGRDARAIRLVASGEAYRAVAGALIREGVFSVGGSGNDEQEAKEAKEACSS